MPLQNRVQPDGQIVAEDVRGLFMGNRGGKLHDEQSRTLIRTQASRQWICCATAFKNRQRTVMGPGYTELFFLDEVTALAAGHRPCFECRRAAAVDFQARWQRAFALEATPRAGDMDRILSAERRARDGSKVIWQGLANELPDGAMVEVDGQMAAIHDGAFVIWHPDGYGPRRKIQTGMPVKVLTPRTITAILTAGYEPVWHDTALQT